MNAPVKSAPQHTDSHKIPSLLRRLRQRKTLFVPIAVIVVPVIRLIRPWILIRWGNFISHAFGHFALNTELYLCERDRGINRPKQKCVDLPFFGDPRVSNTQLLKMWKRAMKTYPASPLKAIAWLNDIIPGGAAHNIRFTANDRDVMNLMAGSEAHISFTDEEEERGRRFLESVGIKDGTPYICLNVRDSGYYNRFSSNALQGHRDSSIENYVLASEALVDRGFFVLRMGRMVQAPLVSSRKEIVDYAHKGMGDDFLDIYLGAKCYMCLSSGSGFDAIPALFRRPVSFVNYVPVEIPNSSQTYLVYVSKGHFDIKTGKQLTFREILSRNVRFRPRASPEAYINNGVSLKENSPEEILDVAVETVDRLQGTWMTDPVGEKLQGRFREIMPKIQPHGEIFIRYSENYLKRNPWWVE
jgi:putative glycosyltransferase (TIGR04372 family)